MKHNIDISIDVHDEHRVKSIRHERVSGNNELQLLSNFILVFNSLIRDIQELERIELERINERISDDDIPF